MFNHGKKYVWIESMDLKRFWKSGHGTHFPKNSNKHMGGGGSFPFIKYFMDHGLEAVLLAEGIRFWY